jgi:hypothetical protein
MAFPTLGVLDTGVRANESPLSHGGDWVADEGMLQIVSNRIRASADANSTSFWQGGSTFGPDVENYIKANVLGGNTKSIRLLTRWTGTRATGSGYFGWFNLLFDGNGPGDANIYIYKVTSGTSAQLAASATSVSAEAQFGFGCVANVLTLYKNGASVLTVNDSTYTAAGKFGLVINAAAWECNDFGGGQLSAGGGVTQAQLDGASMRGIDRGVQRGLARRIVTTNWKRHGSGLFVPAFTGLIAQPAR